VSQERSLVTAPKKILFFGAFLVQISMAQKGFDMICKRLGIVVFMDQFTRDALDTGMPGLVLPEDCLLVVPASAKHDEDSVYRAAEALKKKLSLGEVSPARERVFTECVTMVMILDEERHAMKKLAPARSALMTNIFR